MGLFNTGSFRLHSGEESNFLINCDALTDGDLKALAALAVSSLPKFGTVEGVPRGGLRFAAALTPYRDPGSKTLLIVDDVLTTGDSMDEHRAGRDAIGLVLFARGKCPTWVKAVWQLAIP